MIVVDASVAIRGLLFVGEASELLKAGQLHAPHLVDSEVVHVFRRLERQRKLATAEGTLALGRWIQMGVRRHAIHGLLPRIWELRHNLSAYDASYVALAEALNCVLVTTDSRLAGAPGLAAGVLTVRS